MSRRSRSETRATFGTAEARSDGGVPGIRGYAAVFNRRSTDLGGFTELIDPNAFTKSVRESDVVGLWNHDEGKLLGRTSSGTLRLSIDERGLAYDLDLPDTSVGRDVAALTARGDVTGSSFGFRTLADEWHKDENDVVTRTLLQVDLVDVSPVARPAYPDTSAALRSLAEQTGLDLADVSAAAEARSLGSLIEPLARPNADDAKDEGRSDCTVVRTRIPGMY